MTREVQVTFDCADPAALAAFWASAENRLHLDVRAAPGLTGADRMAALEAEAERLQALGATLAYRVEPAPPLDEGFLTLRDPEGNEFCID